MKASVASLMFAAALVLISAPPALAAPADQTAQEFTATADADGVQRVEVVGGSYFFRPNRIVVKVDVPVEFTVRKESGAAPHNIVAKAPEAGVEFSVELATAPKTIRFTPTKVGTYPLYCSKSFLFFASHRERGMEGVLDVRP